MKRFNPWYILTAAILTALVLPSLVQDGMFMDGMLYTSVSHNLAIGKGTFWHPYFSETSMSFFHEQPPLLFGIQSLFFRVFGDSIYVERFYSFLCAVLSALLLARVWKQFYREQVLKTMNWLPVLFWITLPVVFWAYSNGMEENTMTIFVLLAVLFIFKGLQSASEKPRLLFFLPLAGIFLLLAALTKGFPGLYPLAVIPLHWLFYRRFSFIRAVGYALVPLVVFLGVLGLLLCNATIYHGLHAYLFDRVVNSIQHVSTHNDRFHLLKELFQNLLPGIGMVALLFVVFRLRKISAAAEQTPFRDALFFLLIGLAGALPLMVTLEQRGFYLVTATPFFGMALAALVAPGVQQLSARWKTDSRSFAVFRIVTVLLLAGALAVAALQVGKTRRDADALADIHTFGAIIPRNAIISVDNSMWNDWALQTYMMRLYSISLDNTSQREFLLLDRSLGLPVPEGYTLVVPATKKYNLYRKNK